jgi:hypothetical protein
MRYHIKVSGCGRRFDGEYPGGETLAKARVEAKSFLPEAKEGRIAIVSFQFGPGLPEDGFVKLIEVIHDGRTWGRQT